MIEIRQCVNDENCSTQLVLSTYEIYGSNHTSLSYGRTNIFEKSVTKLRGETEKLRNRSRGPARQMCPMIFKLRTKIWWSYLSYFLLFTGFIGVPNWHYSLPVPLAVAKGTGSANGGWFAVWQYMDLKCFEFWPFPSRFGPFSQSVWQAAWKKWQPWAEFIVPTLWLPMWSICSAIPTIVSTLAFP